MASRSAVILELIALTVMLMGQATQAFVFEFRNNAKGTFGGNKFDEEIGQSGALEIMNSSTKFIWDTFRQQSAADRKNVEKVTLIVESATRRFTAYTIGDEIHLSAHYVGNCEGDVKAEIRGDLYREMTRVWQWNGQGNAPPALIAGVAEYVRLTTGLAPCQRVKPDSGEKWDQRCVTAYFLQYCDSISSGFVAKLNAKLATGLDLAFFNELTGKSVDELWSDYKAMYASSAYTSIFSTHMIHEL